MLMSFTGKGDFSKLTGYLERAKEFMKIGDLDKYGREGVEALSAATPKDTGLTASSWSYDITNDRQSSIIKISFYNSNVNKGVPIAVILQYGHGTRNGGYVEGIDYINPAIQPIFQKIAEEGWREVTKV